MYQRLRNGGKLQGIQNIPLFTFSNEKWEQYYHQFCSSHYFPCEILIFSRNVLAKPQIHWSLKHNWLSL